MDGIASDPVTFFEANRAGNPGCLTVTAIDMTGDDIAVADELVNEILTTLADHPGYLGTLFASTAGDRHFTVTAWRSVEDVEALRSTAHNAAVRAFFTGTLGTRVMTSIWVPSRLNDVWLRSADDARPKKADPAQTPWL